MSYFFILVLSLSVSLCLCVSVSLCLCVPLSVYIYICISLSLSVPLSLSSLNQSLINYVLSCRTLHYLILSGKSSIPAHVHASKRPSVYQNRPGQLYSQSLWKHLQLGKQEFLLEQAAKILDWNRSNSKTSIKPKICFLGLDMSLKVRYVCNNIFLSLTHIPLILFNPTH